ncbi:unnamed protein product [Rotaria magnacalcarata]|uniref:RING-type domain-containing protein n=2 Tax=Rotaria magnacalcarata TaxID=392030 RepID=A0A814YRG4_9BILA|nr:unnamed protein product [Rotaria magnacalcarata]CAF1422056.1 unnamed protein product [Rotaria magnacalcarata]CAF4010891.1 unnamed protein product [Rotaria magnacalcarata]CAF4094504.1 unnamed protein product [Rotaria magnacalcarata]
MEGESSCSSLVRHIYNQHRRDAWNTLVKRTKILGIQFFVSFFLLSTFQCPNKVYNAWKGPFTMNLNQFQDHLETNYKILDYKSFALRLFFFELEYVQIELGKNAINESIETTVQMFQDNYLYGKSLYTLNRVVEPTIDTQGAALYIKFPADAQSYYQKRHPYRFQSFSFDTLQCIVEQLNISPTVFKMWLEKSMQIKNIEQIYDQNITVFNERVIKRCGILIGYFYRPENAYSNLKTVDEYYKSSSDMRIFDASSSYTTYTSHVLVGLFICVVLDRLVRVLLAAISFIYPSLSILHSSMQEQLRTIDIFSVEDLDRLLLNTTYENNYQDCLFIVHDKYIVMSMIDFNETSEKILRQFYNCTPLAIISIDTVSNVKSDCIVCQNNNCSQCIYFSTYMHNINFNPSQWLHKRLIAISDQYRDNWEQTKEVYFQEEKRQHQLKRVIEEEAQYQQYRYRNRFTRMSSHSTPASANFIAHFRLAGWKIVSHSLPEKMCSICLEDLRINQCYAQWPCEAKHTFHYQCMLDALRAGNMCPLCRYPVDAASLPITPAAIRSMLIAIMRHLSPLQ